MRCNRQPVKKRVSRTHNGCGHPYKHSMKGHTWVVDGCIRRCSHCGKTIERLSPRKKDDEQV
jgi:hypothetical protein